MTDKSADRKDKSQIRKTESSKKCENPYDQTPVSEKESDSPGLSSFPIVGIGASAGGLAAFEAFFSGMPAHNDPDMAFVLVQHLAPDHKSILTDLISRYTRMQVFEVEDGMRVKPNCAYIIPPGRDMAFLNGTLQLLEPSAPRGKRLPIDFFFRSLAQDQHNRAICIILSGTGNDGTMGLRAVKDEGGMVMVQSPDTTEYDSMPLSAIRTGLVDYQLHPAKMGEQLIAYASYSFGNQASAKLQILPVEENLMKKIFILLRNQTGHDFSRYKKSTIQRRIERRMAIHQIKILEGYVKYLQQSSTEIEALFRDLLIGVTSFFRDTEAFRTLQKRCIPDLFADSKSGDLIRIWVPGCSTGEEAYSIAILISEYLETTKDSFRVQIFATDIDSNSIAKARAGIYPSSIVADLLPEHLTRFFTIESERNIYRIHKDIRDMLVFSEQNVIRDPPFSRLNLISCRNLLIYMGGDLQKKIIPLFHYSLNPGGMLFLGTSETVGEYSNLFRLIDRKSRLYLRLDDFTYRQLPVINSFLTSKAMNMNTELTERMKKHLPLKNPSLREIIEQTILKQVVPAGALVNSNGDILYLHGHTGMYLEPSPGEIGVNNILKMAREGLYKDLSTALKKASEIHEAVSCRNIQVRTNSHFTSIKLTITPVKEITASSSLPPLYMILLWEEAGEDVKSAKVKIGFPKSDRGNKYDDEDKINTLKHELQAKEEYLQTANEELKSSNEEMQSINEELQSTNEELETSKEEMQSLNEELSTVNAELQSKVHDLSQAVNDMNNLLAGTGIATVFVDHQLKVLRYTPAAAQIINLIITDVGRPLNHIVSNLINYNTLAEDINAVLNSLISKEIEVQVKSGTWYTMCITPYRTLDNLIEGAVITFIDITRIKQTEEPVQKANRIMHLAEIVSDSLDAITAYDLDGRILVWNKSAERMYGWSESEALHLNIQEIIPEELQKEAFNALNNLSYAENLEPYCTQRKAKDGRIIDVMITSTALVNDLGKMYAISTKERIKGAVFSTLIKD